MQTLDLNGLEITVAMPKPGAKTAYTGPAHDLGYVSEFAWKDKGDLLLWAPTDGATTQSVHRTRCELKGKPFLLKSAPLHRAFLKALAEKINYAGECVVIQAHCDDGNDPTLKGFLRTEDGKTGDFLVGLRTTKSSSDPKKQMVYEGLDLSRPFSAEIRILKAGDISITVKQDRTESIKGKLDAERAKRPHVFHWGAYNQIDKGKPGEPKGDGTRLRCFPGQPLEYHGPVAEVVETPDPTPQPTPDPTPNPTPEPGEGDDHDTDDQPSTTNFDDLLDEAQKMTGKARGDELNRITDLIDDADIPKAEKAPLYVRIKAIKAGK